jgi:hypothetical protein
MKIGSKIICINTDGLEGYSDVFIPLPVVGKVYTVTQFLPGVDYEGQHDGIHVAEIKCSSTFYECFDGVIRYVAYQLNPNRFVELDPDDALIESSEDSILLETTLINKHKNL